MAGIIKWQVNKDVAEALDKALAAVTPLRGNK